MQKVLEYLWLKITLEPVVFTDILKQAFNVAILFSILGWDAQQLAAINMFLAIFLGWLTRQSTTPNPNVVVSTSGGGGGDLMVKENKLPEGTTIEVKGAGDGTSK